MIKRGDGKIFYKSLIIAKVKKSMIAIIAVMRKIIVILNSKREAYYMLKCSCFQMG
ncbi:MAG: hypothetical protein LBT18_02055 [Endomicrobium sp.]|jgi:hypothetical protein|nr:hypothetical protein [Endomicrobium sp.]